VKPLVQRPDRFGLSRSRVAQSMPTGVWGDLDDDVGGAKTLRRDRGCSVTHVVEPVEQRLAA
jgi:hypothetical protein